MKIRSGFVSNSSSSSFVVIFPKVPKNHEDVKNMLFKEGEKNYYSSYSEDYWPVDQVAQTVWSDICDQEKNDIEKAIDVVSSGYLYGDDAPNYDDFKHLPNCWEAYDIARDKYAEKVLNEFFNVRKLKLKKLNDEDIFGDQVLYCFEYSDNDGSYGSALEHGGLFNNLKNITVSNH